MKKLKKILLGIALSLMSCFLCVGYAQFSVPLTVKGSAEAGPPRAVIITDVTYSGSSGSSAVINGFNKTVLNTKTTLARSRNAKLTYTITVYNNTDQVYAYDSMIYTEGALTYDNTNIKVEPDIKKGTQVQPGHYLTFNVAVSYVNGWWIQNTVLNSIITYQFKLPDEISDNEGDAAVKGALAKFKEILNTPEDYKTLTDSMDDNFDGRYDWTGTYIGNVTGAQSENISDSQIVETLFDGLLTLTINGSDTPVTVIIKREPVDNNEKTGNQYVYSINNNQTVINGCEMTLYMTAENLYSYDYQDLVPVYAAVFTVAQDANGNPTGEWYQVGDVYLGKAKVNAYSGEYSNGSFDTGTWRLVGSNGNTTNQTISDVIQGLS